MRLSAAAAVVALISAASGLLPAPAAAQQVSGPRVQSWWFEHGYDREGCLHRTARKLSNRYQIEREGPNVVVAGGPGVTILIRCDMRGTAVGLLAWRGNITAHEAEQVAADVQRAMRDALR